MSARHGQRDALGQLMAQGLAHRPGCLGYIVAEDVASADGLWVIEVWSDAEAHAASLKAAAVRALGTRALAMMAGMDDSQQTEPVAVHVGRIAAAGFGLIGRIRAAPGERNVLEAALAEGSAGMDGCISYVVARDAADADALWVTEVWTDEASHTASLRLPQVQAAITRARPVTAGFDNQVRTRPIGGLGLA